MPKFKVLAHQYVEQIAEIEVEAETPEDARQKLYDNSDLLVTAEWKEGDDAYEASVYAVQDADGALVWERD